MAAPDSSGVPLDDRDRASPTWDSSGRLPESVARTSAAAALHHPHRRNDESWVEIASQPSSESLSSIGDDIVTTGLRVGGHPHPPLRRRSQQHHMPSTVLVSQVAAQAGTSSQEEYDETESEEDRMMTSSNEHVGPVRSLTHQQTAIGPAVMSDSEDDVDENATALGRPSSSPTFRPQPNAFSHPPSHLAHRHSTNSALPHHPPFPRPSLSTRSHTRVPRAGPSFMSPSYQADNDAALRASLTTLLSCAAAARGLPKKDDGLLAGPSSAVTGGTGVRPSNQPMDLRLVPESDLMDNAQPPPTSAPTAQQLHPPKQQQQPLRTASNSSAPSAPSSTASGRTGDSKRSAGPPSKPARAAKKKRTSVSTASGTATAIDGETPAAALLSPTLLTWVVSAGVVVLVSVVGFGAGYVIGREVGRQEGAATLGLGVGGGAGGAGSAGAVGNASCGQELVRSTPGGTLRRFRWGSAMGRGVAA